MDIGASIFFTAYSVAPDELAAALEERGFDSFVVGRERQADLELVAGRQRVRRRQRHAAARQSELDRAARFEAPKPRPGRRAGGQQQRQPDAGPPPRHCRSTRATPDRFCVHGRAERNHPCRAGCSWARQSSVPTRRP